jgi:hypothetical protein
MRFFPCLLVACFFACPTAAFAHALGAEVVIKQGKLVVSAFYDDDSDAVGAKVQILEGTKSIATGKTDVKGRCFFELPAPGKYQVTVDAGAGHRTQQDFIVPKGAPARANPEGPASEGEAAERAAPVKKTAPSAALSATTGPREIRIEALPSEALTEGPSRAERTAYPWLKVGIGVGIIGLVALAFVASRVFRTAG